MAVCHEDEHRGMVLSKVLLSEIQLVAVWELKAVDDRDSVFVINPHSKEYSPNDYSCDRKPV